MKRWLLEHFLPMWAKETVLRDNRELLRQIRKLQQQIRVQQAYIRGLELGLKSTRRIKKEEV